MKTRIINLIADMITLVILPILEGILFILEAIVWVGIKFAKAKAK